MCPRQTEAEAITAWNTRIASTEALTAENAKLREALEPFDALAAECNERAAYLQAMDPGSLSRINEQCMETLFSAARVIGHVGGYFATLSVNAARDNLTMPQVIALCRAVGKGVPLADAVL